MSETIRQEIRFNAGPQRIYDMLLDSKRFSEFTDGAAEIDPTAGGAFSCFGGVIAGRNIELVPGRRIVQAWRVAMWPDGVYSIVKFELHPEGQGTRLIMDHSAFPGGMRAHLNGEAGSGGWQRQYWGPLKKHLEADR